MHPEEIVDGLERRLAALEEEISRMLEVLQYAEDLTVVRAAAASGLEALKEIENWAA